MQDDVVVGQLVGWSIPQLLLSTHSGVVVACFPGVHHNILVYPVASASVCCLPFRQRTGPLACVTDRVGCDAWEMLEVCGFSDPIRFPIHELRAL